MNKKIIIDDCNNCPFFDNDYYMYMEECLILKRQIKRTGDDIFNIPDDCPLKTTKEKVTDMRDLEKKLEGK